MNSTPPIIPTQSAQAHQELADFIRRTHQTEFRLPVAALLRDSAFYPASGLDADPIRLLFPAVRSYVYCDYGITRDDFFEEIHTVGFRGYKRELGREILSTDLFPNVREACTHVELDGMDEKFPFRRKRFDPFGHWSVWRRKRDDQWFSFLFLFGEATVVYHGLYIQWQVQPRVLCLIQPGESFGGNWTNFFDENACLSRLVRRNPPRPEYLLTGGYHGRGFFSDCTWSGYKLVSKPQPSYIPDDLYFKKMGYGRNKVLRLWKRTDDQGS